VTSGIDWQPRFLPGPAGRYFAFHVFASVSGPRSHGIVFCPPFAEESNKSRRTVRLAAAALARAGHDVLIVDLHGTGDSDGDFGDGSWTVWLEELVAAGHWLRGRGRDKLVYWGMRTGAALALDACERVQGEGVLLWQPVVKGRTFLTQFIRMRVAGDLMTGDAGASTKAIQATLAQGEEVEVGGYRLTPDFAAALSAIDLAAMSPHGSVHWMEVLPSAERDVPLPARQVLQAWQRQGGLVELQRVVGASFWTTPEIAVVEELVSAAGQLGHDLTRQGELRAPAAAPTVSREAGTPGTSPIE
jgi:exosortase A-associated hydrolase 2